MLDCNHYFALIKSKHSPDTTSSVAVCTLCGEFSVVGNKDGVHFAEHFSLDGSYELLAASQAHRLATQPDAEIANKRIWLPLIFANERLYHVVRSWDIKEGDKPQRNVKDNHIVAARSPSHAAALVEATYEEHYESTPQIVFHHAEGFPLTVLQPLSWTQNGIQLLNIEFDEGMFCPGEFKCPKCQFRLSKRIIDAGVGAVGIDPDAQPEKCPNDSTMMLRVSWREAAEEAGQIAAGWMKRARQLEEAFPSDAAMPADERDSVEPTESDDGVLSN